MKGTLSANEARKTRRNLVTRSHPARTFGGLAFFLALLFLSCGIYLIAEPLLHPMAGHEADVLAGAFTIALASILLFYLAKPAASHHRLTVERHEISAPNENAQASPKPLVLEPMALERTRIRPLGGEVR